MIPAYLHTNVESIWGIREKMIAYQDLSFFVIFIFLLFDIGIERRKDVHCEIANSFCRLFLLPTSCKYMGRMMLTMNDG